jgi:hypothetical protein
MKCRGELPQAETTVASQSQPKPLGQIAKEGRKDVSNQRQRR